MAALRTRDTGCNIGAPTDARFLQQAGCPAVLPAGATGTDSDIWIQAADDYVGGDFTARLHMNGLASATR